MIDLRYMTVEGYCDTSEELRDYLENLTLLPAKVISWHTSYDQEWMKMRFRIEYQPLVSMKGVTL